MINNFPNVWITNLLAYKVDDIHLTIVFDVLTPENNQLAWKVANRLFNEMPKILNVRFTSRSFHSPYNDKLHKIAVDVDIGDQLDKWIPAIERYIRAKFRPHISIPIDDLNNIPREVQMELSMKQGTMHKDRFVGFPQYKYKYIFGGNEA